MSNTLDGIFEGISSSVDNYDNKLREINKLETEREQILSESCYNIYKSKKEILKFLNDNRQYLAFLPSARALDSVIDDLSNDRIKTMDKVKLLQKLLAAIYAHTEEEKRYQEQEQNKGLFKRFISLVREDIEDVN